MIFIQALVNALMDAIKTNAPNAVSAHPSPTSPILISAFLKALDKAPKGPKALQLGHLLQEDPFIFGPPIQEEKVKHFQHQCEELKQDYQHSHEWSSFCRWLEDDQEFSPREIAMMQNDLHQAYVQNAIMQLNLKDRFNQFIGQQYLTELNQTLHKMPHQSPQSVMRRFVHKQVQKLNKELLTDFVKSTDKSQFIKSHITQLKSLPVHFLGTRRSKRLLKNSSSQLSQKIKDIEQKARTTKSTKSLNTQYQKLWTMQLEGLPEHKKVEKILEKEHLLKTTSSPLLPAFYQACFKTLALCSAKSFAHLSSSQTTQLQSVFLKGAQLNRAPSITLAQATSLSQMILNAPLYHALQDKKMAQQFDKLSQPLPLSKIPPSKALSKESAPSRTRQSSKTAIFSNRSAISDPGPQKDIKKKKATKTFNSP